MGALKEKMIMKMELKNFSRRTIQIYLFQMKKFVRYYGKSPDLLKQVDIEKYLHSFYLDKKSISNLVQAYSSLKFFYTEVLERREAVEKIPRPKTERKMPVVLSLEEVRKIIDNVKSYKSQTVLMTIYSAGLRLNEAISLKIRDIDSHRMTIRVEQGKGRKDRYSILSKVLLERLREYYRAYKPKEYLFAGKYEKPINSSTIQRAFNLSKKKRVSLNRQLFTPCDIVLQHIC
ncbi:MAG TPA: integrase [Bacteroidetes bacterium]|nr:integrase [Bacteroidota bacterium]